MEEIIIAGIFTLLGSLISSLGTFIVNRDANQKKKYRYKIKMYLKEIENLRQKLPDEEGSKKYNGIKNEFRAKNEINGNECITITANQADRLLLEYKDIE